ncbi:MAG: trypsin-like peptidase domain-containing protein [Bdellovibrionales bacterium]|nr:trypsin-like peptidase domain-containing protein [Bdellovibrionales bacterium]
MNLFKFLFLLFSFFLVGIHGSVHAAESPCQIVNVSTKKAFKGRSFQQFGVGWVVKDKPSQKYFVLTPAHVAGDADSVQIFCNQRALKATLKSHSKVLDLALLEVSATKNLKPLFEFDPTKKEIPQTQQSIEGAHIYFPQRRGSLLEIKSINRIVLKEDHGLLGIEAAILSETTASRPGVSGSPLIYYKWNQRDSVLPVGMVLQSRTNFHNSVGLPIQAIWTALKDLVNGRDPWQMAHPSSPNLEFEYEQKTFLGKVTGLIRYKKLTKNGFLLQEVCADSENHEVSQWSLTGGGDWADDGGGDWADDGRGGDWADDSGKNTRSSEHSGLPTKLQDMELYGVSKYNQYCDKEGLKLSSGSQLIAISDHDSHIYRKVTSISDIFDLALVYESAFGNYIEKYGQFLEDPSLNFSSICNEYILGPDYILTSHFATGLQTPLSQIGKDYVFHHDLLKPPYSADGAGSVGVLCKPTHLNRLAFARKASKTEPSFMFVFEANNFVVGSINVGKCLINLDSDQAHTQVGMWSGYYKGQEATIHISFSPQGSEIFKLSVMDVNKKCEFQSTSSKEIWMYNYRMLKNLADYRGGWLSLKQRNEVQFKFISPKDCENGFFWTPETGAQCH